MSDDQHWLVRHRQLGGHVHVDIWCGTASQAEQQARPKLGELVMSPEQWDAFKLELSGATWGGIVLKIEEAQPTTGETTEIHDGPDPEPIPEPKFEPEQLVRLTSRHKLHRDQLTDDIWTPSEVTYHRTVEAPGHPPMAEISGTVEVTVRFTSDVPLGHLEPLKGED